jgi:hypothetical protein
MSITPEEMVRPEVYRDALEIIKDEAESLAYHIMQWVRREDV